MGSRRGRRSWESFPFRFGLEEPTGDGVQERTEQSLSSAWLSRELAKQVRLTVGSFSEQRDPSVCAEDQRFEPTHLDLELIPFQQRKNLEGHLEF